MEASCGRDPRRGADDEPYIQQCARTDTNLDNLTDIFHICNGTTIQKPFGDDGVLNTFNYCKRLM